jgi:hypothetical protein
VESKAEKCIFKGPISLWGETSPGQWKPAWKALEKEERRRRKNSKRSALLNWH